MKKVLALCIVLCLCLMVPTAYAEDFSDWINKYKTGLEVVKKLELTAGTGFSILDYEFKAIFTKKWAEYKGFSLSYGHDINNMLVGTVTYNIFSVEKSLPELKAPILDMVNVDAGLYGGWKRVQVFSGTTGNNEWDFGIAFTILRKTF